MKIISILISAALMTLTGRCVRAATSVEAFHRACVDELIKRPISGPDFVDSLNRMGTVQPYMEVSRTATRLNGHRRAEIRELEKNPTLSKVATLLGSLLPIGSRFKLGTAEEWVSLEPTATDDDAAIGYSGHGIYVRAQTNQSRRAEFYISPLNVNSQTVASVKFMRDSIRWWDHLRILLIDRKPHMANAKSYVYQELNLYYDHRGDLRAIVIRNKRANRFARWHAQDFEIPSVIIVPGKWLEYHWSWLTDPIDPSE